MDFRDPMALMGEFDGEFLRIPSERFFNDGRYKPLQDKWGAAAFGIGYGTHVRPCRVALRERGDRGDADFFLETAGQVFPFQLTERMREGRRRGDEFKKIARVQEAIAREPERRWELLRELATPYRSALGAEEAPELIEQAIAMKAQRYGRSEDLNLVVYLNLDVMGLGADIVRERAEPHRHTFASIWVLTGQHLCSLFSNPQLDEIPGGGWGPL